MNDFTMVKNVNFLNRKKIIDIHFGYRKIMLKITGQRAFFESYFFVVGKITRYKLRESRLLNKNNRSSDYYQWLYNKNKMEIIIS